MTLRVDQNDITFGELADIEEAMGCTLSDLFERSQARGMAAVVWVIARRENPAFTMDDALAMKATDLEVVTPDPNPPGVSNGAALQPLPASGL